MRVILTVGGLVLAGVHFWQPTWALDGVTIVFLLIAVVPWLAPVFKSIQFPGGWKVEFAQLEKVARDQTNATLHQTLATVINWVQAPEIREGRRLLYEAEDSKGISRLNVQQWQDDWKQAADMVSQAFNSAAIIAQQDERLQAVWIEPTRRAILKTWWIVQPRIEERRRHEPDLWQQFEWLVTRARTFFKPDEEQAWREARPNTRLEPTAGGPGAQSAR